MRYTKEVSVTLLGDKKLAQRYVSKARTFLGQVINLASFGNIPSYHRSGLLDPGVSVRAGIVFNRPFIEISAAPVGEEISSCWHGLIIEGAPEYLLSAPLYDTPTIQPSVPRVSGNTSWTNGNNHVVSWEGPDYRYKGPGAGSTIYQCGKALRTFPNTVLGAAIFENVFIVATSLTSSQIRFEYIPVDHIEDDTVSGTQIGSILYSQLGMFGIDTTGSKWAFNPLDNVISNNSTFTQVVTFSRDTGGEIVYDTTSRIETGTDGQSSNFAHTQDIIYDDAVIGGQAYVSTYTYYVYLITGTPDSTPGAPPYLSITPSYHVGSSAFVINDLVPAGDDLLSAVTWNSFHDEGPWHSAPSSPPCAEFYADGSNSWYKDTTSYNSSSSYDRVLGVDYDLISGEKKEARILGGTAIVETGTGGEDAYHFSITGAIRIIDHYEVADPSPEARHLYRLSLLNAANVPYGSVSGYGIYDIYWQYYEYRIIMSGSKTTTIESSTTSFYTGIKSYSFQIGSLVIKLVEFDGEFTERDGTVTTYDQTVNSDVIVPATSWSGFPGCTSFPAYTDGVVESSADSVSGNISIKYILHYDILSECILIAEASATEGSSWTTTIYWKTSTSTKTIVTVNELLFDATPALGATTTYSLVSRLVYPENPVSDYFYDMSFTKASVVHRPTFSVMYSDITVKGIQYRSIFTTTGVGESILETLASNTTGVLSS